MGLMFARRRLADMAQRSALKAEAAKERDAEAKAKHKAHLEKQTPGVGPAPKVKNADKPGAK